MIHLTRLILKPWTMFTARVHSSRPGTSQVSLWPQSVIFILVRTICDTKHCHQEPASGRRTPPGLSPAPLWPRRWVYSDLDPSLTFFDPWPCIRWMVRRWRPPPPSTPCATAAWGRGAQSASGSKRGESAARRILMMRRGGNVYFSGRSKSSSASWISLELRRIVNQMLDSELRKVFYHQASSISPTMKTLTSYLWHLLQQWLTICFRLTSMLRI